MGHPALDPVVAISGTVAQVFVTGLWEGMVFVPVVALGLRLLSRGKASARFLIWALAFALVVAVPFVHLRTAAAAMHSAGDPLYVGSGWGLAIAGLWALATGVRLVQLSLQALRVRRVWRRARPLGPAGEAMLPEAQAGRRGVEVCLSAEVDAPCVIGFLAPRLLLPEGLPGRVSDAELRQIVLHEYEHLRRHDDWVNLLQKVALVLFPLNPALFWMDRRLAFEREMACDAGVVARTSAPLDYARCLTQLAEHRLRSRGVALALSAWTRRSELAARVDTLLRPGRSGPALQTRLSAGLLALCLAGGALEMARAPQLVAFTDVVSSAETENARMSPVPAATAMMMPVVERQADQPRTMLLKAALPPANALRGGKAAGPMKRAAGGALRIRTARATGQFRVLRTAAAMQHFPARDVRPAGDRREVKPPSVQLIDFSSSYAAVPFEDGWLIFKL